MNAAWDYGCNHADPPQWVDLPESEQVRLSCGLIDEDDAWFYDALTDMHKGRCVAALLRMDSSPLGLELRRCVLDLCRKEVERRLENWEIE